MGILSLKEAMQIILNNRDRLINETNDAIVEANLNRKSTMDKDKSGADIIWSIVRSSEEKIPEFIAYDALDVPIYYPYSEPYTYVCLAIIYKYSITVDKKDKKNLSDSIKNCGKKGLYGLVLKIVRTYCDNIESATKIAKRGDKTKQTAINTLAENMCFFDQMFPDEAEKARKKYDVVQRIK